MMQDQNEDLTENWRNILQIMGPILSACLGGSQQKLLFGLFSSSLFLTQNWLFSLHKLKRRPFCCCVCEHGPGALLQTFLDTCHTKKSK